MMNEATQLQLQAYVDGELTAGTARRVAEWLDQDPEARELFAELQHTKVVLARAELDRPLPVPSGTYWAAIERQISAPPRPTPDVALPWWFRWGLPVGAVTLGLCLMILARQNRPGPAPAAPATLSQAEEIETPLAQPSFISFRSEADGMSVVWVDTR